MATIRVSRHVYPTELHVALLREYHADPTVVVKKVSTDVFLVHCRPEMRDEVYKFVCCAARQILRMKGYQHACGLPDYEEDCYMPW